VTARLKGLMPAPDVIEAALVASQSTECVVIVHDVSEAEVRFANNTTTTNGLRRNRRVSVVAIVESDRGLAAGVATRSGSSDVVELVRAAEANARSAPPAADATQLIAGSPDRDFALAPPETDLSILDGVLSDLVGAFERARASDITLAGYADHTMDTTYLGTSAGVRRRFVQPTGSLQMMGRGADGRRSSWVGIGTDDFVGIEVETVETELRRRLEWATRSVELPAGRYEVIMPPSAVADMVTYLYSTMAGQDAEDGKTVFSRKGGGTRVGDRLSTTPFEMYSDPLEPSIQCAPFLATTVSSPDASVFDNGVALDPTSWIADGVLRQLTYHRAGAEHSGVSFASPIDNLVLRVPGATAATDDLIATTERGLLLTCLWYIREVDPSTLLLTGLTRDGVYLVEDGKITGAVNNFRFNESPVDLLARTIEVGATVRTLAREFGDYFNRTAMPALRVADFNMSSVSPAS
jgi:predicted Zn-dependent protease